MLTIHDKCPLPKHYQPCTPTKQAFHSHCYFTRHTLSNHRKTHLKVITQPPTQSLHHHTTTSTTITTPPQSRKEAREAFLKSDHMARKFEATRDLPEPPVVPVEKDIAPPKHHPTHLSNGGATVTKGGRTGREHDTYIGFANLPNQVYRKSVKKGFDFTLMLIGGGDVCMCVYVYLYVCISVCVYVVVIMCLRLRAGARIMYWFVIFLLNIMQDHVLTCQKNCKAHGRLLVD